MRFRRAVWLVPPAFALHVAEEAPGFTRWVNRRINEDYSRADFARINAAVLAALSHAQVVARQVYRRGWAHSGSK